MSENIHNPADLAGRRQRMGRIGLALSGGAALGIAHIGALRALEEAGIKPDILSGTSAGAIIGGLYASGLSLDEIENIALSIDKKRTVNLLSPTFQRGGLADAKNFSDFLKKYIGNVNIEDLPLPFVATAVDFQTGNLLYLREGRLLDAIRASVSIPGVFVPVEANGTYLVDGGLRDNLPLQILRNYDVDTLLGVNALKINALNLKGEFARIDRREPIDRHLEQNFIDRIAQAMHLGAINRDNQLPRITHIGYQSIAIMLSEITNKEIQIVQPDLVVHLDVSKFKLWEFWRAREIIDIGYHNTREQLQEFLEKKLEATGGKEKTESSSSILDKMKQILSKP